MTKDESISERKKKGAHTDFDITPPFPREFQLDITSLCNYACVFCSNRKVIGRREMDPETAKSALKQAYDAGTRMVGLYGTGEPFTCRHLPEYVAYAKGLGYEYAYITSNGALADEERAIPVLEAGLDSLKFSISAGSRESYSKIHGVDCFDQVLSNLRMISEFRKKSGLDFKFYVTMVVTDQVRHEVDALREMVEPYIDEWDPHVLTNTCGNNPENNELADIEAFNIRGRRRDTRCFQPFKGFTVTPEGYVSACVLDYQRALILGDLSRQSLVEIWNSDLYKEFRRKHRDEETKGLICYGCIHNVDEPFEPILPEYAASFKE